MSLAPGTLRTITITIPADKDPYLVYYYNKYKRVGETVKDFAVRMIYQCSVEEYNLDEKTTLETTQASALRAAELAANLLKSA